MHWAQGRPSACRRRNNFGFLFGWLSGNYSPSSAQASFYSDRQTSLIWSGMRAYPHKNGVVRGVERRGDLTTV